MASVARRSYYWCEECNTKTDVDTAYKSDTDIGIPYGVCTNCDKLYFSPLGMEAYKKQLEYTDRILGFENICKTTIKEMR